MRSPFEGLRAGEQDEVLLDANQKEVLESWAQLPPLKTRAFDLLLVLLANQERSATLKPSRQIGVGGGFIWN
jgi:hypothetical protein